MSGSDFERNDPPSPSFYGGDLQAGIGYDGFNTLAFMGVDPQTGVPFSAQLPASYQGISFGPLGLAASAAGVVASLAAQQYAAAFAGAAGMVSMTLNGIDYGSVSPAAVADAGVMANANGSSFAGGSPQFGNDFTGNMNYGGPDLVSYG